MNCLKSIGLGLLLIILCVSRGQPCGQYGTFCHNSSHFGVCIEQLDGSLLPAEDYLNLCPEGTVCDSDDESPCIAMTSPDPQQFLSTANYMIASPHTEIADLSSSDVDHHLAKSSVGVTSEFPPSSKTQLYSVSKNNYDSTTNFTVSTKSTVLPSSESISLNIVHHDYLTSLRTNTKDNNYITANQNLNTSNVSILNSSRNKRDWETTNNLQQTTQEAFLKDLISTVTHPSMFSDTTILNENDKNIISTATTNAITNVMLPLETEKVTSDIILHTSARVATEPESHINNQQTKGSQVSNDTKQTKSIENDILASQLNKGTFTTSKSTKNESTTLLSNQEIAIINDIITENSILQNNVSVMETKWPFLFDKELTASEQLALINIGTTVVNEMKNLPNPTTISSYHSMARDKKSAVTDTIPPINSQPLSTGGKVNVIEQISKVNEVTTIMDERTETNTEKSSFKNSLPGYNDDVFTTEQVSRLDDGGTTRDESSTKQFTFKDNKTILVDDYPISTENSTYLNNERIYSNELLNTTEKLVSSTDNMISGKEILTFNTKSSILNNEITLINDVSPETRVPLLLGGKIVSVKEESEVTEQSFSTGKTSLNFETPTMPEKSPLINDTKSLTNEISDSTKESALSNNKIIPIKKVVSVTEKDILTNDEIILNDNLSNMTEQSMLSNKSYTIMSDVLNESKQTKLGIIVNKESHGIEQSFSSTGIPLIDETSIIIDTSNLSNNTTISINKVPMETKISSLFTNKTSISEILFVTEKSSLSNKEVTSSDAESNVRKQTVLLNNEISPNNQVSDKPLLSTQRLVFTKSVQTVNEHENISDDELTLTKNIDIITEQATWPNNIIINTIKKSNENTQPSFSYIVFTFPNVGSNESLQSTQSSQDVNYINSVTQKKKPSTLENNKIASKNEVLSVTEILSSITDEVTPKDKLSNVSTESTFSNNENKLSLKIPLVLEQATLSSLEGGSNNNLMTLSTIFNASKVFNNNNNNNNKSFTNMLLFPNKTQTSDIISAEDSLSPNSQVKSTYVQKNETINNENNTSSSNLITEEITSENISKIPTNITNNTSEHITLETVEILPTYDTTFGNEQLTLGDNMSLKYNQLMTTEQTIIIQNNEFTGDSKKHSIIRGVEISTQKFSNIIENITLTNYLFKNKSLVHIEPTTVSNVISPSTYRVPSINGQTVARNNIPTLKNKHVVDTGIVGLVNNPERPINVVVKNNTRNQFIANMTGTSNHGGNNSAITTSLMKKNTSSYGTTGQTLSSVFMNITTNAVKNVSTSPIKGIERKFNYGEKLSSSKTGDGFSIVPTTSVLFTLKNIIPLLPMESVTTSNRPSRFISKSTSSVYISPTTNSQYTSNDISSQRRTNSKVISSDLQLFSSKNVNNISNTEPSYSSSSLKIFNHSSNSTLLNKLGLTQINSPSFIPVAADRLSSINQTKNVSSSPTNITSSVMLFSTISSVTQPHPTIKMLYTPITQHLLSDKQNIFVKIGLKSSTEQVKYEKPPIKHYHDKGTSPIPSIMKVEEASTPISEKLTSRLLPGPLVYLMPEGLDYSKESNESKIETLKPQAKTKNNKHNNTKIPLILDLQPGLYTIPNMDRKYLSKPTSIKPNIPIVTAIESLKSPNKFKSSISNVSLAQVPLVIQSEELDSSNESKEENRKTSKEQKRTKHRTSRPISFSNVSVPVMSSIMKTEERDSSVESEDVSMEIPKTHSKTKSHPHKNTQILKKEKLYSTPRISEIYFTTPTITKYSSTLSKTTHLQFQCTQVGLFGDKTNCKKYHICYTYLFWFKQQDIQCTRQEGFSSIRKSCVPILLSDCYLGNQINKVKINNNIEEKKLKIPKRKPHNSDDSDES